MDHALECESNYINWVDILLQLDRDLMNEDLGDYTRV
jgi:hypothetical protein